MHPRFEYTFFERGADVCVVAKKDLLASFLQGVDWQENEINILGTTKGQNLELLNTQHPLYEKITDNFG